MTIQNQDYRSLIKLYSEIEASVSPDTLKKVEKADSPAAEKIAKEFFLVAHESVKGGKKEVSLHFQMKHAYDFFWGAVRKFFGFGATPNYSFANNFKLIKKQLEAVPSAMIQEPEKLERLRNIVNALVRHVEGKNYNPEHEISRIFVKTAAATAKRPLPPTPSSKKPVISPKKPALPAVKVPLNSAEKELARLIRGDEKGDRDFLDYFLKEVPKDRSTIWTSANDKKIFPILGITAEKVHAAALCIGIQAILKKGDKVTDGDLENLDMIVSSLKGRLDTDSIQKEFDTRQRISKSNEFKAILKLATTPENKKSASEKIATKFTPVRHFLDRLTKEIPTQAEINEVTSLLLEVEKAQKGLEPARGDIGSLTSLPAKFEKPKLPDRLDTTASKTITGLLAHFQEINRGIAEVASLKEVQKKYSGLQKELATLQKEVKNLTADPFYGAFLDTILPFSKPLITEIQGRDLLHDFYRSTLVVELAFQDIPEFSTWLGAQSELFDQYKTAINALQTLKTTLEAHLDPKLRIGTITKEVFLQAFLNKKWPALQSQPYKNFRHNLDADQKYATPPHDARLTESGYWNAIFSAQSQLQALSRLPRYNFDSYVNGLSKLAQTISEAIVQYSTVWERCKDGKKLNYKDEKELFDSFVALQKTTRQEISKLQKELTTQEKSARTHYLDSWAQRFQEIKLKKPTSELNRSLEMSIMGSPPRLSHQAKFDGKRPPAEFETKQNELLDKLKKSEDKGESVDLGAALMRMKIPTRGKPQSPTPPPEKDEWGE